MKECPGLIQGYYYVERKYWVLGKINVNISGSE